MSALGQTEKNSVRADVFRSSPENGHPRERLTRSSALRQKRSLTNVRLIETSLVAHGIPHNDNLRRKEPCARCTYKLRCDYLHGTWLDYFAPDRLVPYDDVRALMGVIASERDTSKGI